MYMPLVVFMEFFVFVCLVSLIVVVVVVILVCFCWEGSVVVVVTGLGFLLWGRRGGGGRRIEDTWEHDQFCKEMHEFS